MEETNATPDAGGASTLDRLERFLGADNAPPEQKTQAEPQGEADPAPSVDVEPTDDGVEPDAGPQLTTSDLAKYLGIDESALDLDEDGTVKFKTKVDGKEGAAKLAEMLKSYQLEGHVNKKSMELAAEERRIQARVQEAEQQAQQRLDHVEQLVNFNRAMLNQRHQSINWMELRHADPGQYAALQQDLQAQNAQIDQMSHAVNQQRQQFWANLEGQRMKLVSTEDQRLYEMVPEWKDQTVRQKETSELWTIARERGVPPELIQILSEGMATPRGVIPPSAGLIALLRDGLKHAQLQKTKPAIENKVRTAPKLAKPGQAVQNTAGQELRNLKQSIVKSGGRKGIADYLIAAGKV